MNNLVTKDIRMTSIELAEITGKGHKNILRDIRYEIQELGEEISRLKFEPREYESRGKKYPLYILNKSGVMQLVLRYDPLARHKALTKLEELEKGQVQQLPQTYEEMIIMQAQSMQDFKTDVDHRFKLMDQKVDNQITLDHKLQRKIQKAVGKRVYELLGEGTDDYKRYSKKYFAAIYRDIKNRMGIPSYKDVKKMDYEAVLNYVKHWVAPADIKENT